MKCSVLVKQTTLRLTALVAFTTMPIAHAIPIAWNGWTFDYTVGVNNEGLALKNLKYQTHTLLKKISLPVIISGDLNAVGAPCELPPDDQIDAAVTSMPWANNATISQRQFSQYGRQWYEIGVYKKIAEREYFQAYYLSNDGLMDAHLYSRGGIVCPENAIRSPHWRVDTDIDGAAADVIETTPNNYPNFKVQTVEFSDVFNFYNPFYTVKRARDTVTNTSAVIGTVGLNFSHPDGNVTQPPRIDHKLIGMSTAWEDFSVLYKPTEDTGASALQTALVNSENINGQDVVYWYKGVLTAFQDYNWGANPLDPNGWLTASITLIPNWNTLPDVVVDDFTYDHDGHFTVTVTNLGATVPAGKTVGVGLSVDGVYKTYVSSTTLLHGETRTLTTSEFNRFYIPAGVHTVTAWVDDINRFAESNEANNKLDKPLTAVGPTVKITAPAKNATVSGSSVVLAARASDPIGVSTAAGGAYFYMDGQAMGNKLTSPYALTWNSNNVGEGWHALTVIAFNKLNQRSGDTVAFKVVRDINSFLPDIAVTALSYANGKFSCTLKNVGTGSIPSGVWISLAYYVDGVYRSWTTTSGPLTAGASIDLGTLGSSFNIPAGSHTIKVIADDQRAIAESDDNNNQLEKIINIP